MVEKFQAHCGGAAAFAAFARVDFVALIIQANRRSTRAFAGKLTNKEDEYVPAVLRSEPYRVYFLSHELHEPPHVHIDRDAFSAKFWLNPVALAYNLGFPARELRRLEALITEHQT